jgi:hypothetical protein
VKRTRLIGLVLLALVALVAYSMVFVYAHQKLGNVGALLVIAILSWPLAWIVTLPMRIRGPRRR